MSFELLYFMKNIKKFPFKSFFSTFLPLLGTTIVYSETNTQRSLSSCSSSSNQITSQITSQITPQISYLNSKISKEIDDKLMFSPGFSLDQLMELAGLSVATAVKDFSNNLSNKKKILIICGPGNNGGDGLVAARHLYHFGFEPTIVSLKLGKGQIFQNLIKQCEDLNIPIEKEFPINLDKYDIILDSLFGFSFIGPAKPPYDKIINQLATSSLPVISVDIPSGWHVDQGDIYNTHFTPTAIISLTAPKKCVESYQGVHYLGGR